MSRGRRTLSQRIALEGGEDIRKELSALGKEGEAAFKKLEEAALRSGKGGTELDRSVKALNKSLNEAGKAARAIGERFQSLQRNVGELGAGLRTLRNSIAAVAAAAGGAGAAIVALANAGSAAADAAGKAAQSVGLSVQAYGELQFAAEQSGVSQENFANAVGRLNRTLADAAAGNENAIKQFNRLGVSFRDASGNLRPTQDVLGDIAERFSKLPDGAQKSALAFDLFGKAGAQLIPFLNEGRDGLAALSAEARRLGLTFNDEQVKIATALQDQLNQQRRVIRSLRDNIGLIFAPDVTNASRALTNLIAENRKQILAYVQFLRDEATGIVLDFIRALSGDEIGVERTWVIDFIKQVQTLATEVSAAFENIILPIFRTFTQALDAAAQTINAFFGTDFSGTQIGIAIAIGQITGSFRALAGAGRLAIDAALLLKDGLAALGPIARTAAAGIGVLRTAMGGLLSTLVRITVIGALVFIYFDDLAAGARRLASIIEKLFSGDFGGAWEEFKEAGFAAFEGLENASVLTWAAIVFVAVKAIEAIGKGIKFLGAAALWKTLELAAKKAFLKVAAISLALFGGKKGVLAGAAIFGITLTSFLDDQADESINELSNKVKEIDEELSKIGENADDSGFRSYFRQLTEIVNEFEQEISPSANNIDTQAERIGQGFERIASSADSISPAIRKFGREYQPVLEEFTQIVEREGQQIETTFQRIANGWRVIRRPLEETVDDAKEVISSLAPEAERAADDVSDAFSKVEQENPFEGIEDKASEAFENIGQDAQTASREVSDAFQDIFDRADQAGWKKISDLSGEAFDEVSSQAQKSANEINSAFEDLADAIPSTMEIATKLTKSAFQSLIDDVNALIDGVLASLQRLESQTRRVSSQTSSSSSGSSPSGFATGGHVRGPGTGTSDSILAYLSNGEYVIKARAVRHYGAGFLEALNKMRLPRNGLPRFATGGMVQTKNNLPAFSIGGLVEGFGRALTDFDPAAAFAPQLTPRVAIAAQPVQRLHPLNLTIGGETISGLMAPEETAQQLVRVAGTRSMVQSGRKPGWFYG